MNALGKGQPEESLSSAFDESSVNPSRANLPPLEQIRDAEMSVARHVAAAREAARTLIETAQRQADDLKREAEQSGRLEGQAQYADAVARAKEAAAQILAQAQRQVEQLRGQAERDRDSLVSTILEVVAGAREETP
jgi:vacuolar-type H+-ATPase subunit H